MFFAAIGLGFLLIEIVLIQRFVLFLGFPTYSLSVVLFSLLLFTGVGSALTSRYAHPRGALARALTAAVALLALSAFGLQPLLRQLIDLPLEARVVISMALLAPIGVTLGMAMPIGPRRLEALKPTSVPYAWAVNGIASVVASVLGIAFAIRLGFSATSLLAAGCYAIALLSARTSEWPSKL